jgi:hypothetical protein
MGINNIIDLIKKKSPDAIKQTSIKDYRGKIVSIDASMVK